MLIKQGKRPALIRGHTFLRAQDFGECLRHLTANLAIFHEINHWDSAVTLTAVSVDLWLPDGRFLIECTTDNQVWFSWDYYQ